MPSSDRRHSTVAFRAVKSMDCRESALALQRPPGLMRSENTHLLLMANWANDLDFALRSQTLLALRQPLNRKALRLYANNGGLVAEYKFLNDELKVTVRTTAVSAVLDV
jgi:hypothetical protein